MIRTVEKTNIALVDTHLKQVRTSVLAAKKGENSGTDAASSVETRKSHESVTQAQKKQKSTVQTHALAMLVCMRFMD